MIDVNLRNHLLHNVSDIILVNQVSRLEMTEIHFEMEIRCENLAGSYFLIIFSNNISQKRTGIKSFYFLKSVR